LRPPATTALQFRAGCNGSDHDCKQQPKDFGPLPSPKVTHVFTTLEPSRRNIPSVLRRLPTLLSPAVCLPVFLTASATAVYRRDGAPENEGGGGGVEHEGRRQGRRRVLSGHRLAQQGRDIRRYVRAAGARSRLACTACVCLCFFHESAMVHYPTL